MTKYKAPYRLVKPPKKGGIYYYRMGDDPKRTRHSTGYSTEIEARKFCEKMIAFKVKETQEMLFGDFSKDFFLEGKCPYLANKRSEGNPISEKLRSDYRAYLVNYINPYFCNYVLNAITIADVRKWRTSLIDGSFKPASLRGHPPANNTMNKVKRIFQVILKQAKEENLISSNPVQDVGQLSKQVYKKRDILTNEEIAKLFPEDEKELLKIWRNTERAAMLYLVLTSGIRAGELRALKWSSIDWNNKGIRITQAIKGKNSEGLPKGKRTRGSLAPTRAFDLLLQWQTISGNNSTPDSYIFPGSDGKSPSSSQRFRNALKRAMTVAGINVDGKKNIVVHSLRHTYNTKMGYTLSNEALHGTIGHESDEMTRRYDHLSPDDAIKQYGKKYRKKIEMSW